MLVVVVLMPVATPRDSPDNYGRPACVMNVCHLPPPQPGHLSPSKVSIADICLPVPNRNRKL